LVNRLIPPDQAEKSQFNLIQMLSGGTGNPFPIDVARAIQLIRVNSLCKGNSGIRLSVLETVINMLNKEITPFLLRGECRNSWSRLPYPILI